MKFDTVSEPVSHLRNCIFWFGIHLWRGVLGSRTYLVSFLILQVLSIRQLCL